jgi:HEAT repeat protein
MREKDVTKRLVKELPNMPPDVHVSLIYAFADRGDLAARPAIAEATGSTNAKVRTAALEVLGRIGDASSVELLVQTIAKDISPEEKNTALNSLRNISGDGVDTVIVESMKNSPPGMRPELIQILIDRNVVGSVPDLLKEAENTDENVSKTAFNALGKLAGEKDLPSLVRLLVNLQSNSARKEAERAAVMVSRKIGDKGKQADIVLEALQNENRITTKCSLLRVLGGIANEKAFEALQAALKERSTQVQDEAVRAVANWTDDKAIDVLRDIFQNTTNETYRVLALRGYVRLMSIDTGRPSQETLKMYGVAMNHAYRPEERKLVLAGLANVRELEALKMVQQCLDDEATKAEAALAAVKIAGDIIGSYREQVKTVMNKVITISQDAALRKQAEKIVLQIEEVEDFNKIEAVPIFNGQTFVGWEGNLDMFRIEDGAIVGGTLKENVSHSEYLCTTKQYSDFELSLNAKLIGEGDNAGIQFRSRRIPNKNAMFGYQADMGTHMGKNIWGSLYDEGRRNGFVATANQEELAKVFKRGDWNEYVIRCLGKRIQLWVNGYQAVDYTETDDTIEQEGLIGLQVHGGHPSEAWYKDIVIKEIRDKK